jgi:hypothetical protein
VWHFGSCDGSLSVAPGPKTLDAGGGGVTGSCAIDCLLACLQLTRITLCFRKDNLYTLLTISHGDGS